MDYKIVKEWYNKHCYLDLSFGKYCMVDKNGDDIKLLNVCIRKENDRIYITLETASGKDSFICKDMETAEKDFKTLIDYQEQL